MDTLLAKRDRCTAAWPALLPPPTTKTRLCFISPAVLVAAP